MQVEESGTKLSLAASALVLSMRTGDVVFTLNCLLASDTQALQMNYDEQHHTEPSDQREKANTYGDLCMFGDGQAFLGNAYIYNNPVADKQGEQEQELLFKALYYESMNVRKNHVMSADKKTCQWIWSTAFRRWLRACRPKAFWVAGKPGSGKSTLMKYLARSTDVRSNLSVQGSAWIVVSFFFDFRLADEIGNSVAGLLRSLLLQILEALPQTNSSAAMRKSVLSSIKAHHHQSQQPSTDDLSEAFRKVIHTSARGIFVLVDGLDEFSGNMMQLLDFLLSLRKYSNVKLCLASRPEPLIHEVLGMLPNIHMSDHNEVGIQQHISLTIQRFQPRLDVLKLLDIQEVIVERAQGVFLWVYLAVEEILQACLRGATAPEVRKKLTFFPSELEALYQRILDRTPLDRREEAAIMYTMVSSATFQVTLALLQSTMRFVILQLGLDDFMTDIINEEHFIRRFHSTMGGLLELAPVREELYCDFEDFEASLLRVRLLHETVRSFTRQSQWSEKFIPKRFRQLYPNNFWHRISSKALIVGNIRTVSTATAILSRVHGQHKTFLEFIEIIKHCSNDDNLLKLAPLLHHSIRFLPAIYELGKCQPEKDQLRVDLQGIMRCRLASMHFALVGAHFADGVRYPSSSLEHEVSDLMIAAGHKNFNYVRGNENRVKHLQDRQRDDLVMAAVFPCRQWGSRCADEAFHNHGEQAAALHDLVDMILSYNNHYSSFHLAIFVILGFGPSTRYIRKLQNKLGPNPRHTWESAQLPRWNHDNDIGPLFPKADPLCLWACRYDSYPQQSNDYSARLKVLISLGVNVNQPCVGGGNIIHYIISTHFISHRCRIRGSTGCYPSIEDDDTIEKLGVLENHGVDFTATGPFGTPLQTLEYHRAEQGREAHGRKSVLTPIQYERLGGILRHKELTNHLPRPLPTNIQEYTNRQSSEEPACEICNTSPFENPRPVPVPVPTSQSPTLQPSPARPSPSRIPRPRRRPLQQP